MYTIKMTGAGAIFFRGRDTRLPAIFKKVSKKELERVKVICHANGFSFEIMEEESERLKAVVEKAKEEVPVEDMQDFLENSVTKIEDLFEEDDTLGKLIEDLGREPKNESD